MSKTASAKPPEPREVIDTRGAFRSGLRGAPDRERGGQPQRMAWRSDPGGPYSRPAHSVITRGRDSRRSERTPHEVRSCGEGADEDVLSDYVLVIRPSIDLPEQCGCMEGDAGAARRARRDLRNAFERRLRIRPTALTTADRLRHLVAGTGDFHRREVGRQAIGGWTLPSHSASVRMTRDTHSGNPTARVRTSIRRRPADAPPPAQTLALYPLGCRAGAELVIPYLPADGELAIGSSTYSVGRDS